MNTCFSRWGFCRSSKKLFMTPFTINIRNYSNCSPNLSQSTLSDNSSMKQEKIFTEAQSSTSARAASRFQSRSHKEYIQQKEEEHLMSMVTPAPLPPPARDASRKINVRHQENEAKANEVSTSMKPSDPLSYATNEEFFVNEILPYIPIKFTPLGELAQSLPPVWRLKWRKLSQCFHEFPNLVRLSSTASSTLTAKRLLQSAEKPTAFIKSDSRSSMQSFRKNISIRFSLTQFATMLLVHIPIEGISLSALHFASNWNEKEHGLLIDVLSKFEDIVAICYRERVADGKNTFPSEPYIYRQSSFIASSPTSGESSTSNSFSKMSSAVEKSVFPLNDDSNRILKALSDVPSCIEDIAAATHFTSSEILDWCLAHQHCETENDKKRISLETFNASMTTIRFVSSNTKRTSEKNLFDMQEKSHYPWGHSKEEYPSLTVERQESSMDQILLDEKSNSNLCLCWRILPDDENPMATLLNPAFKEKFEFSVERHLEQSQWALFACHRADAKLSERQNINPDGFTPDNNHTIDSFSEDLSQEQLNSEVRRLETRQKELEEQVHHLLDEKRRFIRNWISCQPNKKNKNKTKRSKYFALRSVNRETKAKKKFTNQNKE